MACSSSDALLKKRERMARHRADNPDHYADMRLRRRFNLSLESYLELLATQGGCAICGTSDPGGKGRFHVDHDHECCPGKHSCGRCIRGLLCTRCNVAIAMFRDDPLVMKRAITYVSR